MNIISVNNVCKNYKSKVALDNVSLAIKFSYFIFALLVFSNVPLPYIYKQELYQ